MQATLYNPLYIRLQAGFSQWLRIPNFEPSSPRDMPKMLTEFMVWLQDNNCHRPHDIRQEHLKKYLEHLHERPSKSGQESFTVKQRIKGKSSNVKSILNLTEISSLYEAVKDDTLGLRDKAILALYYGCGLRKNEGANINVKDILLDKELVYVRKGKGYKERYVPLAGTGKADLENYILYGRPLLATDKKEDALLLNVNGTRLSGHMAYERLQKLKAIAKIKKPAGLHTLRHSIASHLLHSGMALEQIQRFLGHSSMESTQIYTHLKHEQI